jgi:disulfide bond formation protein DsbB
MSVEAVETFYGILALVAMVSIAAVLLLRLAAVVSTGARDRYDDLVQLVAPNAYAMAWVVAFLATAGSLYFSEVAGFEPCRLCWYQRIAMYPLVVILAIAAARRERAGAWYAIGMALVGAIVSGYHVLLEWFPLLDAGACSATTPCTLVWFRVFGFISLPTLALTAFVLILVLMAIRLSAPTTVDEADEADEADDAGIPIDPVTAGGPAAVSDPTRRLP